MWLEVNKSRDCQGFQNDGGLQFCWNGSGFVDIVQCPCSHDKVLTLLGYFTSADSIAITLGQIIRQCLQL